jgi:hypothetical protein
MIRETRKILKAIANEQLLSEEQLVRERPFNLKRGVMVFIYLDIFA